MQCKRVSKLGLVVDGPQWSGTHPIEVAMMATPVAMQPTGYIVQSWTDRPYGTIQTLTVDAIHDGHTFAVRIRWETPAPTESDFPPAVAIALPAQGLSPLALMGTPEAPIHILRWQGGRQAGVRSVLAKGIGTSNHGPDVGQKAVAAQTGNQHTTVITRALGSGQGAAPLQAGAHTRIGFAAWDGGNGERAGIKSFSPDLIDLILAA
jgi:DMSO reductase family type II enzyme heme b subunit